MTKKGIDHYLDLFRAREKESGGSAPAWLARLRREAIDRFEALGFPTVRQEAWRFTDVSPIAREPFRPVDGYRPNGLDVPTIKGFTYPGLEGPRLVFVNGHFAADLSDLSMMGNLPDGVRVGSLARAIQEDPGSVEPYLTRQAGPLDSAKDQPFVALNSAFLGDGAFIHFPKGLTVSEPIHLLFLSVPAGATTVSHPRNLIVAEEGSRGLVIESYGGHGEGRYYTNAVTEVIAGSGAVIEHCKVQEEAPGAYHTAVLRVRQECDSSVVSHSISLGGALVRNDLNFLLGGRGVDCTLNGLYVVGGNQHVDHHTTVDHAEPNGTSRELYKGILDDTSQGVFHGKIIVRQDAQKTNARQTNKNLVLSEKAGINTQPSLEIYADDVKCTHGATIGQLDPLSLYYLRSRGITETDARTLLTYGFMDDVIGKIGCEPVRAHLECLLLTRIREASRIRSSP